MSTEGQVRIQVDRVTDILGADAEWNRLLAGVAASMPKAGDSLRDSARLRATHEDGNYEE